MPEEDIKAKYIALLEEEYANRLREVDSVPQDLYTKYTLWLRGKIKQALQMQQAANQPIEENTKEQKSA
jgi:hypothetical protein